MIVDRDKLLSNYDWTKSSLLSWLTTQIDYEQWIIIIWNQFSTDYQLSIQSHNKNIYISVVAYALLHTFIA